MLYSLVQRIPCASHKTDERFQTRQKLKEAYDAEFLATIERAEKQIILARHGRRLLQLLDDSPVVPGDENRPYNHGAQARQILNDAEDDLKDWQPELDDQHLAASQQLHSPTTSSVGGEQQKSTRQVLAASNTGGEAAEETPTANPQGEPRSIQERGGKGDDDRRGPDDIGQRRRISDAENIAQSPQQQLEGSTTVMSGSPVSSVDGWRQHGNMLRSKQPTLAF